MTAIAAALWFQSQFLRLLTQTGPVAKGVLLILLVFSVISWAIMYSKYSHLKRARQQTDKFLEVFRKSAKLPEVRAVMTMFPLSPLAVLYEAGMREVESQVGGNNPHPSRMKSMTALSARLQLAASEEMSKLERRMSWLATTGSVTPFIGLFGTVWGIIDAFMGLGTAGAASLRAVAPGIAEALITTAAGLFAAIPAVIAYNHFLYTIKEFSTRMDNFTMEFVALVEKQS